MPPAKKLIEVNGVVATLDDHIARTGYSKSTVYHKASAAGLTVEEWLNDQESLEASVAGYEPKTPGDPFIKGYPWDIRGCENIINYVFEKEFKDMVHCMAWYIYCPSEKRLAAVKKYEGWWKDAYANYYDTPPEVHIKVAWEQAKKEADKMKDKEAL